MTTKTVPVASVVESNVGPKLFVYGVEVYWWLGTNFNSVAYEIAAEINAAAPPAEPNAVRAAVTPELAALLCKCNVSKLNETRWKYARHRWAELNAAQQVPESAARGAPTPSESHTISAAPDAGMPSGVLVTDHMYIDAECHQIGCQALVHRAHAESLQRRLDARLTDEEISEIAIKHLRAYGLDANDVWNLHKMVTDAIREALGRAGK